MQANPGIYNPNLVFAGQTLVILRGYARNIYGYGNSASSRGVLATRWAMGTNFLSENRPLDALSKDRFRIDTKFYPKRHLNLV